MEQADHILEVNNISKSYGPITALENATLRFADKKIYGLFGRNGAGKTTLLNIMSTRIFADRGNVTCFGEDVAKHPEAVAGNVCYMPEKSYFPGRLSVKNLLNQAQLSFPHYDEAYAERLFKYFLLTTDRKYNQLSKGHESIFRIVIGLASKAPITIFDEPVLGLDAVARDRFYSELIREFSRSPRLFIISTHLIEESADLFNEAIIIKNGEIIKQASVEELLSKAFYVSGKASMVDDFLQKRTVLSSQTVNSVKTAVVEGDMNTEKRVPGLLFSPLTIQKLFIHLTKDLGDMEF